MYVLFFYMILGSFIACPETDDALDQNVPESQITSINLYRLLYFITMHQCKSECPKIYRKSVLHLLKYTANLYLSRCSGKFWDTQYVHVKRLYDCTCMAEKIIQMKQHSIRSRFGWKYRTWKFSDIIVETVYKEYNNIFILRTYCLSSLVFINVNYKSNSIK